jgi:transglutaminase-like putative cysteine protease
MASSSSSRSPQSPSLLDRIQTHLDQIPVPETEESIALRVLVQLLVTVGIVAVDVAAVDTTARFAISLWAVPASAIGATWSWHRRRNRNIGVKFCIAIAMVGALVAFFLNLISQDSDTRLVLAELLIQLQVLHSFDLPRRKDLGYSMMIGLILIGVAATLSQTLIFGALLILFLAIALPVLILDYRSRLGMVTTSLRQAGVDLAPKRFVPFFLIVAGLGLTVFLFLPRLPGYQLRNFPISAPIEHSANFDGRNIMNPGYVRGGQQNGANGQADDWEAGPGELDQRFYYGFNTRMNQNLRGELVPEVVMRVRSQSEGFWRVLAFDQYTGQGWEISRNETEDVETLRRSFWSYRFLIPPSLGGEGRTREVIQTYTVVSPLPNLIPALYSPREVYFPTEEIAVDREGGLRSPVSLADGLTYTVISEVPYRDRTALAAAPQEYPNFIRNYYLEVPDASVERIRQETERILAAAPNPPTAPSEIALYLAQYLKQNYAVLPDLPFLEEGEDLVESFLFESQGGYPDHFSTVLTMLLRSVGIPARLVVGFGPGQFNPFTGYYIVRNVDAYAMAEVYIPNHGWFGFDPIPGHEVEPPSFRESDNFSMLRRFWNWVAGWLPSPVTGFLSGLVQALSTGLERISRWITALLTQGWIGVIIGLAILMGLGLAIWLSWGLWKGWRYRRWLRQLHPMESLYQQMVQQLQTHGLYKSAAQTPFEFAAQCREHYPPEQWAIIDDLTQAYVTWRYGRRSPQIQALSQRLKQLTKPETLDLHRSPIHRP